MRPLRRLAPLDDGSQPSLQEEQAPLNLRPSIPGALLKWGAYLETTPGEVAMTRVTLNRGNSELLRCNSRERVVGISNLLDVQRASRSAACRAGPS